MPAPLLDEPVQPCPVDRQLQPILREVPEDGLTRMVVTHRLEAELLEQYDEIFVLRGGEVCERGRFGELMERSTGRWTPAAAPRRRARFRSLRTGNSRLSAR